MCCPDCGGKMTAFAASHGGAYEGCENTYGTGSHESYRARQRADDIKLLGECREALRASHEHIQQSEAVNSYNRRGRDAAQLQRTNTSLRARLNERLGEEVSRYLWRCQNCLNLTIHEVRNRSTTTTFTCTKCGFEVQHTHTVSVVAKDS